MRIWPPARREEGGVRGRDRKEGGGVGKMVSIGETI